MNKTTKYISMLRGINVGGNRKILMTDLKNLYADLGYTNIITYIQSGNVIFDYKECPNNELSARITEAISEKYGFDVPVMVRTREEWVKSVESNPFANTHKIESLHLTLLSEIPDAVRVETIRELQYAPEDFQVIGKDVFILCPGKYHQSKLSNQFLESKLKVKATTRNWKTVLKLLELS